MKLEKLVYSMLLIIAIAVPAIPVKASSHREAPFITELPKVDGASL